ncbi:MAG: response regulator transcription factor [Anaerolineales bacterium]|nr:response regulator transcription factor [Anaerolineales bacterium]
MTVNLLLADDHPIVRQGLCNLLENEAEFKVVGEAGDGVEAVALVERLKPDVLIVDMMLPNLNGLEVMAQARKIYPALHLIVLSMQCDDVYVVKALENGASAYVLKDTGPSEIVQAVREVIDGGTYFSPKLSNILSNILSVNLRGDRKGFTSPYESLTDREREILQMIVEGSSSKEIGRKLSISHRTVELHRSRMMKKLGLHNRMEVLRYALKHGILEL